MHFYVQIINAHSQWQRQRECDYFYINIVEYLNQYHRAFAAKLKTA